MSIVLDNISKSYGGKTLFEKVCAVFHPGQKYGLTGPNGAGKSTLLKIITGQIEANTGSISLPKKVGILSQNIDSFKEFLLLDVVMMGNQRLWDALQERDELYKEEIMTDKIGLRLGDLEEIIAEEDGYTAEIDAEQILLEAGIPVELHVEKMGSVPLNLQFRALLCKAMFGNPEALLLDEPTNHLDLESIGWLERCLCKYSGTLIVISHDRHFLNTVTNQIADIDYDTIIVYPGNYDAMVSTKTSSRERELDDIKSKEKKISQLKEFVAKFGAGTRASQVQSRIKEIDKLQPQDLKKSNIQRPYIRFPRSEKQSGKTIFSLEKVCKSYGDNQVISDFSIEIYQGDKIGIVGNNGLGKTTLLKMLAGVLAPDSGKLEIGHQVLTSYFPQEHRDIVSKTSGENSFDWLRSKKQGMYDQEVRSVLGKLLFAGDDAFKQVGTLSGGETARLILAGMMLDQHNTILLDEPNNHLDLEAVSALGWGLNEYPGTTIAVSHDRDLLSAYATRLIALEPNNKIVVFEGTLEEYLKQK